MAPDSVAFLFVQHLASLFHGEGGLSGVCDDEGRVTAGDTETRSAARQEAE